MGADSFVFKIEVVFRRKKTKPWNISVSLRERRVILQREREILIATNSGTTELRGRRDRKFHSGTLNLVIYHSGGKVPIKAAVNTI